MEFEVRDPPTLKTTVADPPALSAMWGPASKRGNLTS